ncbi:MAG: hypothetical protein LUB59_04865 [Candidatus Gastranaerophilales bacterium]|nr:hypothetical protein [Candidatus Gastranaerophilales bacterium]
MKYLDKNKSLCSKENAEYVLMSADEYSVLQFSLDQLKRVNRERQNASRGLTPKKERSGYILLSYDSNTFKMSFQKNTASSPARRLLLETPYTIKVSYDAAKNFIMEDLEKLKDQLQCDEIIDKKDIKNSEKFIEVFEENDNIIYSGLELQRGGTWAVRLYANYSVVIPEDMINFKEDKKGGE